MRTLIVSGLFAAALPLLANAKTPEDPQALGPIVVTATRTEQPVAAVGSSVTVITREEIERRQALTMLDLLRTVPGVDVVASGGPGGVTSVFTRGSNSNHTLVLVDGVEASDPSNPTGQFDFANLLVDDIERIEIVRGPQSVLYGSDALGGVIQIITRRRARGESGLGGGGSLYGGHYGTVNGRAQLNYALPQLQAGVTTALTHTDGLSAASFRRGNPERDAYRNRTFSGYLKSQPTAQTELNASLRHSDARAEIDNFDSRTFVFGDDTDSRQFTEQLLARIEGGLSLLDNRWRQRVGLSYDQYDRNSKNGAAPNNTNATNRSFNGAKTKLDWQHDLQWLPGQLSTLGLEAEQDSATTSGLNDEDVDNRAVYFQHQAGVPAYGFYTTLGLRYDDIDRFGSKTTWRLAPSWQLPNGSTRLRASAGTGFKAPTLTQLFDNSFGSANPNLKPEQSRGWDVGIEQRGFDDRFNASLTYFNNNIRDLINFDPVTFQNVNIDRVDTKGMELEANARLLSWFGMGASYTRTEATDRATRQQLLRRPEDKAVLNLDFYPDARTQFTLGTRYIGPRRDFDDTFSITTLPPYVVVDALISYQITPQWRLQARAENLEDQRYEEVFGFGTPRRGAYAGVSYQH